MIQKDQKKINLQPVDVQEIASESLKKNYDQDWQSVSKMLGHEIGQTAIKNWIDPLVFISCSNAVLVLSAPTRFVADWVRGHYADAIKRLWRTHVCAIQGLEFKIEPHQQKPTNEDQPDGTRHHGDKRIAPSSTSARSKSSDYSLSTRLDPRLTFENFVTGPANALAHAAAKRVCENEHAVFNPLFLYGGVGIGKTHLMHAIGHDIAANYPSKKCVYMSAEKFMYHFVTALRENKMMDFKTAFRGVDVLMIDDIQFIGGKASTQQEFMNTFNALLDQGKQIIVAADKPPAALTGLDDRLKSRLSGGLAVDIQPADLDLRRRILAHKAKVMEKSIGADVIECIAARISTNVRELEGALNRVLMHADLMQQEVTVQTTQSVLGDVMQIHNRKVNIEDIQKSVAGFYKIKISDMSSVRRLRAIARPRQIAMYLSKTMTSCSLPEIGRQFGGRDHTTVMHAVKRVTALMNEDVQIAQDITDIERQLTSL